ncbi:glycosyltransferase family A protein [Limnobacter profundi]|uniref:Glycosyltransferase family 2 protein n=1 Tax=Limnobacter profundi TaxID=2732163 RepID=A0ABX6NA12_9BURK|nr:glycosyltransferase family A protein [Limnobacter sp. SAORIC-580]QJR30755.1 glycosyltransferase family 2 protein [Limnobacter sp. SAORIC-580]
MTRSPILFLIFNRPDTTARVFDSIRKAKPSRLYIAADGPRDERAGEADLCEKTRGIAQAVDWPCEVKTLLRHKNLGCKKAVSGAIDWFFENELEGIILEDDCLPAPDFFRFCDALLEKYRDEPEVGSITGDNFISSTWTPEESYYFSKFSHIWGWATWRRAWKEYDVSMTDWPKLGLPFLQTQVFEDNRKAAKYWSMVFDKVYLGDIDTWDYQWAFTCFKNNWLSCIPKSNLVTNIGFGPNATHTTSAESKLANVSTGILDWPIKHPQETIIATKADEWSLNHVFEIQMHFLTIERLWASFKYRISLFLKLLSRHNRH